MFTVTINGNFSSAHQLRGYEGKCENLHGHNWDIEATVSGSTLNETGMLIDFKILKNTLNKILKELDHCFLNEIFPFTEQNPTAENIAFYIFNELNKKINDDRISVQSVKVWENKGNQAEYSKD